jgi:hypothetical protein
MMYTLSLMNKDSRNMVGLSSTQKKPNQLRPTVAGYVPWDIDSMCQPGTDTVCL